MSPRTLTAGPDAAVLPPALASASIPIDAGPEPGIKRESAKRESGQQAAYPAVTPAAATIKALPRQAAAEPDGAPVGHRDDTAGVSAGLGETASQILAAKAVAFPAASDAGAALPVVTEFGGLFYLVNVALAMRLYGDFTQPLHPGLALSPWDFLALAGPALVWLGPDGRPGLAPARPPCGPAGPCAARRGLRAAGRVARCPRLARSLGRALCGLGCTSRGMRLLLLHPAGFAFAQVRRTAVPPRQAAQAIVDAFPGLGSAQVAPAAPPALPRGGTARWIALLAGVIAARLEMALGVPAAQTPALLCRHPGRVRSGRGRLDVELPLAGLPITVRMAGLDRDPGWIPAAGHAIAFRFA